MEAHPSTLEAQPGAHLGAVRGPPVIIKSDQENFHVILKGQCHEIFDFWFFHESVSPKPLSIQLGQFLIFSKIRGDFRSSRCATGVDDTGGK